MAGQAVFGFGITVGGDRRRGGGLPAPGGDPASGCWPTSGIPLVRPLFAVGAPGCTACSCGRGVRVLGPEVRFLLGAAHPGGLGLEVTTAAAVGGTGAVRVRRSTRRSCRGSTGADAVRPRAVRPWPAICAHDFGVDIAKVVTELGSFATVAALLVAAVVVLLAARAPGGGRRCSCSGIALVYLAVDIAKEAIDRPRPAGPLVSTSESAFPSGHAAYSTPGWRWRWCSPASRGLAEPGGDHHRRAAARGGHRPVAGVPARALLVGRGRRLGARRGDLRRCWPRSRWSSRTSATMSASRRHVRRPPLDGPHDHRAHDRPGQRPDRRRATPA